MKIGQNLIRAFLRVFSQLPLGFHYAWAGFFAWLLQDVLRYRKNVVMINLARSFPDKKYKELVKISRDFYHHFGCLLAESIWFGGCLSPERLHKQHLVEVSNPEVLQDAFDNSPSVMILNSHCGNWELLGGLLAYDYSTPKTIKLSPEDCVVVYKPLSNKMWDEIMRLNRCAPVLRDNFDGYISSDNILRYAINHRNDKRFYIMASDQHPYSHSFVHDPIDFMHQPTETMLGGSSMASKFKMSVLYMNMLPTKQGHYQLTFTKIASDASTMDPHDIMVEFYSLLQKDLEAAPANYLWSHKRWK